MFKPSLCFRSSAASDHVSEIVGDAGIRRDGTAYCIVPMRVVLACANAEVGGPWFNRQGD